MNIEIRCSDCYQIIDYKEKAICSRCYDELLKEIEDLKQRNIDLLKENAKLRSK